MPDIVTRVEDLETAAVAITQVAHQVRNIEETICGQSQVSTMNTTNTSLLTQRVQNIEVALFELERAAESLTARLEERREDLDIEDHALKQLEGVL